MSHYSVDFESYFDDEISIKTLGAWRYLQEQTAKTIYLVSIFGPDVDYVGHPSEAPWGAIESASWESHNAAFDILVKARLEELGAVPEVRPPSWQCTANLSCYLGAPRDLKGASKALLKKDASKDYRKLVKGRQFESLSPDEVEVVLTAGRQDAQLCWEIWDTHSHMWPDTERELSLLTIEMAHYGVYIDQDRIRTGIKHLKTQMWEADQQIPWAGEVDEKGKEVARLSLPQLHIYCRAHGIPAPTSVAQDSEECEEWLDQYGIEHPVILACRTWRRCNAILKKLEAMLVRVQPNGRMGYGLKYFGAHTGRWSGDAGWNVQNLHKEESFGVNLRACIVPPPGKKFIIADLSQIEPRTEAWIIRDQEFLDLCEQGMSPYEAHARISMNWTGGSLKKEDQKLYALAKARLLALGYGAGFLKFITMAKKYQADACFDEPVTPEQTDAFKAWLDKIENKDWLAMWDAAEGYQRRQFVNSWLIVMDYRKSNPKIAGDKGLWKTLNDDFKRSIKDGSFQMVLPSGRTLTYRKISCAGGSWTTQVVRGGVRHKFYGGKLTENLVQATARDVFADAKLRLRAAGHRIVLSVHDEVVIECDPCVTTDEISSIITQPVPWMPGLPIACEAMEAEAYCK